jgi:hypothetical protein
MHRKFLSIILLIAVALVACGRSGDGAAISTVAQTAAPVQLPATEELPTDPPATAAPTAAPATDAPTIAPTETSAPTDAPSEPVGILCPDVPRPAIITFTGAGYEVSNPLTGARCPISLPWENTGPLQVAGDNIYFVQRDPDASRANVARFGPDGAIEPLAATATGGEVYYFLPYAVAPDGSRVAWGAMRPGDDPTQLGLISSLWIAAPDGGERVAILEDVLGAEQRIAAPLRFSADGATLFFTWQPEGLGGIWTAFNGRYDNLYRVPAAGGEPEKLFDCADHGLFLCLGDFREDGTLAYIDMERVIHVVGGDGAELTTIATSGDYAGYPTFTLDGGLIFYTAELTEDPEATPFPAPGIIHFTQPPYTGAPVVVASADGLLVPSAFLNSQHLVVGYAGEDGGWGMALLDLAAGGISPLEPWPSAQFAAVWPAE